MNAVQLLLSSLGAALAAALLTAGFRRFAIRRQLLDVPNSRSSHDVPTPRGGGAAIVLVTTAGLLFIAATDPAWRSAALMVALAGLVVAAVGLVDDYRGLAASRRFIAHAASVVLLLFATRELGPIDLPGLPAVPALQAIVAAVLLVWLLNLFNFMDGIDGLAGMEAVFVSLGLALCLQVRTGVPDSALLLCLVIAGASGGFLTNNWPPARIFMGDVGSGFLGLMLGALALIANRGWGLDPWVPAILLGVFVTDATVTVLRRMARRERWYQAHRSHAYQRLSRRFGAHRPVTIGALAINLCWLLPLALCAAWRPAWAWLCWLAAYTPLVVLAVAAGAGEREESAGAR